MNHYFASDIHLGAGGEAFAGETERRFVAWLDDAAKDAESIFLVGDLFDFWFEYREVVPKGFVRTLGKLAELTDRGVRVVFFTGNHDMWVGDSLARECGVEIYTSPQRFCLNGKHLFIAHGDNMKIDGQPVLKLLNTVFRSRTLRWLFSWLLHPDWAMRFGHWWSGSNRKAKPIRHAFRGAEEPIVRFASDFLKEHPGIDLFVCGHIHCAEIVPLAGGSRIAFLGEWIDRPTYGKLDQNGFTLNSYPTTS